MVHLMGSHVREEGISKGLKEVMLFIMTCPTDNSFRILQVIFIHFFIFLNLRKG